MLIPVSLVAQIVSKEQLQPTVRNVPFLLGEIPWREFQVPIVSGSAITGGLARADEAFQRSVILWPMKGGKTTDFFAVSSHDAPKVVNVEPDTADATGELAIGDKNLVLGAATTMGSVAAIPDLNRISSLIFGRLVD